MKFTSLYDIAFKTFENFTAAKLGPTQTKRKRKR